MSITRDKYLLPAERNQLHESAVEQHQKGGKQDIIKNKWGILNFKVFYFVDI